MGKRASGRILVDVIVLDILELIGVGVSRRIAADTELDSERCARTASNQRHFLARLGVGR